jgi:hypothetical protein
MAEQIEQKPHKKQLGKTKTDLQKRARIAAQAVINGADAVTALVTAGYSKQTALTNSTQILNNPVIKETFNRLLDKAGLTDDYLAAKIKTLADAKETKFFTDKGIVTDQRDVEALGIQTDITKFAAKVKGHVIERSIGLNLNVDCGLIDLEGYGRRVKVERDPDKTGDK